MVETSPPCCDDEAVLAGWAQAIREAAARGTRLAVRGGGSKAFYGEPLPEDVSTVDTRPWRGIVRHEPTELVVRARTGTPLAELEALLARHGQYLPFEPPHFGPGATVGGMVAAGLAGPARAAVGGVRDYVLGVRLLNGRGEDLFFGGEVMKNVAGYDISRLLVGSMGSLGVITEVALKVLPRPAGEATLRLPLAAAESLQRLAPWRAQPLPLNASAWIPDAGGGALWLRLRGAAAAVRTASARLLAEAGGETVEPVAAHALWESLREQTHPFFTEPPSVAHGLWRLAVPPATPWGPAGAPVLAEWFGAQRWVWATAAQGESLRAWARQAGGHATLFRAPAGPAPATARQETPAPVLAALQRRVLAAFDPHHVFAHRLRLA